MKTPELKNREQQFWHHLHTRAKYAKGWDVKTVQRKNEYTRVRFTCLHGRRHDEPIHLSDLEGFMANPKGLADQYFRRAVKWCKGEHIDLQVNTWYSTPTPTPTPWGTLTLAPGKPMYVLASPIQWTAPVWLDYSNDNYVNYIGGSNSIVSELLSICPGLGKVQRPCPECKAAPGYLTALIPHVNDAHQWSREKIAEWLDIIALDDPTVDFTIQPKKEKHEYPSVGPDSEKAAKTILGYGTVTLEGKSFTAAY